MNRTKIEWVRNPDGSKGYTWNPVTGCRHGCSYCYAKAMCRRFAVPWGLDPKDPFKPMFHVLRLNEPMYVKKPLRIFIGSMCDLFGNWVPRPWIEEIIWNAEQCPQHTFIFLTKNPRRYAEFTFPPNCWLGVTYEGYTIHNQIRLLSFDKNAKIKNIKFISWEPILYPFSRIVLDPKEWGTRFNWLILGAMTGPGAKKYAPRLEWIEDAEARCRERDIPIFEKSSLAPIVRKPLIQEWPR